jgi:Ca-activated chloride channel family protein
MRLRQIAEATGGEAFFPSSLKELDGAYEKVLAEVRAQYQLGYQSTNTATDGAWRRVEIKVKRPDAKLRSRKGYFAPYKEAP